MHHSMLAEALAQRHPHGERIHVHRETSKRRVSVEPGEVHARVHDYLVAETTGVLQLDLRALEQCKGADLVVHLSVKRDVKERCCS